MSELIAKPNSRNARQSPFFMAAAVFPVLAAIALMLWPTTLWGIVEGQSLQWAFGLVLVSFVMMIGLNLWEKVASFQSLKLTQMENTNSIHSILNALPLPTMRLDENGTILERNAAADLLLERVTSAQPALGLKLHDFLQQADDKARVDAAINARFRGLSQSLGRQHTTLHLETVQKAHLHFAMIKLGGVEKVLLVLIDVESTNPQLSAAAAALAGEIGSQSQAVEPREEAQNDPIKAKFLAVMSHELRTPLNGIVASIELLKETTSLDDRQNWLVDILENCGTTALDQVTNLLELTRLSAPDYSDGAARSFAPLDVAKSIVKETNLKAKARGNIVAVGRPLAPVPYVMGHENLYRHVLNHLISNAVKFTENGQINVDVRANTRDDTGMVELCVAVRDNGIGIERKNLQRIFDSFEAVDNSYTRIRNGSGLGLSIANKAAQAMGGRLRVDSTPGEGSLFELIVTLPAAVKKPVAKADVQSAVQEEQEAQNTKVEPLRILVAEDNAVNRDVLREILEVEGHNVHIAKDGKEAARLAATERYDAVLMDISMPYMDGMSATEVIRAAGPNQQVPIIGVTAHALPDEIDTFLASGMDDVIVKPIRKKEIRAVLYRAHLQRNTIVRSTMLSPEEEDMSQDDGLIDYEVIGDLKEILDNASLLGYVDQFYEQSQEALVEMKDFMAASNWGEAAKSAHKAAGLAATVGALSLQRLLNEFERDAKSELTNACASVPQKAEAMLSESANQLRAALQ